jgi:hypothetical protein
MNRRDLFRSAAWLPLSAAQLPAREIPTDADASRDLARADWRPIFLDAHQNDTLVAFADLLIPATATPGAKASDTNRFIDLLLAAESPETQRAFLNAVGYLDGESRKRYGAAFSHAPRERQMEFMHLLAYPRMVSVSPRSAFTPGDSTGYDHFKLLKGWVARAFYSSDTGMRSLGWDGSAPHGDFQGCQHPSHEK